MKYILFGAAQYLYDHIDKEKIRYFSYIVDNSAEKIGTTYLGKPIKSPQVLLEENRDDIFIVITAFTQLYSIEYELRQMGFEEGIHFIWFARLPNLYPKHSLWLRPHSEHWARDESAWRKNFPNEIPHERAELVAKMVNWTGVKSVLDLGAGSEPMRSLLPETVDYFPVDYKQLTGNTLVHDFNQKHFPDIKADVVILVGVLGYVDYGIWLVDKAINAVNSCGQFIVSLNYYTGNFSALDCIKKYSSVMRCVDYAFRSDRFGLFTFVKEK